MNSAKRSRRNFVDHDKTILKKMVKEAFSSVLPVTLIVLVLCFTVCPLPSGSFLAFILGAVLLVVGMGVFTLGADAAMLPIGDYIGRQQGKRKKLRIV